MWACALRSPQLYYTRTVHVPVPSSFFFPSFTKGNNYNIKINMYMSEILFAFFCAGVLVFSKQIFCNNYSRKATWLPLFLFLHVGVELSWKGVKLPSTNFLSSSCISYFVPFVCVCVYCVCVCIFYACVIYTSSHQLLQFFLFHEKNGLYSYFQLLDQCLHQPVWNSGLL